MLSPAAGFSFCAIRGAWNVRPSICSLPTSALRTKLRVGKRTGWMKPNGVEVNFICLEEQLSVVGENVTIYFVGDLSERFKRLKRKWTRLHR